MSAATMSPPPINVVSSSPSESAVSDAPLTSPPPEQQREGRSIKKRLSLSRATKGLRRMMRPSHSHVRPELEYYDVCLRQEDIDNRMNKARNIRGRKLIVIVRPGEWLNDSNIEFFYEWMEREKLPKTEPQKIFLLRPSIGYLVASIAQQGGAVDDTLLPNGILDADYIFIPITDNVDPTKAGGSHWSLLLVGVEERTAWYLDSLPTTGADKMTDARCYVKAMNQVFGIEFDLTLAQAPKQHNGSDCGIHVCMETDILLSRLTARQTDATRVLNTSLADQVMNAQTYRESLQKLIHDMIQYRGKKIGCSADIAVSPERRSTSRQRPSIDQRLRPTVSGAPVTETIKE